MRIYEGDYAYEIEQMLHPQTQVPTGWRYNVYRIRPWDQLIRTGKAATRDGAERAGKAAITDLLKLERRKGRSATNFINNKDKPKVA